MESKSSRAASERIRSRPPLDPSAPPSVVPIPLRTSSASGALPVAKPILASDCLRDDLAPIEPHARATRVATAAIGVAMAIAGAFTTARVSIVGAGLLLVIAAIVRSYRLRAAVVLLVAATAMLPAAAILAASSAQPIVFALRAFAPSLLAAVLAMRATYRAHRGTRVALALALVLFAAAALFAGGVPAWGAAVPIAPRMACFAMGAVALLSLFGFMSEETTGGAGHAAVLALLAGGGSLVIDAPSRASIGPSMVVVLALSVASVALFQLAAVVVAPRERARQARPGRSEV